MTVLLRQSLLKLVSESRFLHLLSTPYPESEIDAMVASKTTIRPTKP